MRIYKQNINGIKVTAYRDADSWVIYADGMAQSQRFSTNAWGMREAMRFAAKLAVKCSMVEPTQGHDYE